MSWSGAAWKQVLRPWHHAPVDFRSRAPSRSPAASCAPNLADTYLALSATPTIHTAPQLLLSLPLRAEAGTSVGLSSTSAAQLKCSIAATPGIAAPGPGVAQPPNQARSPPLAACCQGMASAGSTIAAAAARHARIVTCQ